MIILLLRTIQYIESVSSQGKLCMNSSCLLQIFLTNYTVNFITLFRTFICRNFTKLKYAIQRVLFLFSFQVNSPKTVVWLVLTFLWRGYIGGWEGRNGVRVWLFSILLIWLLTLAHFVIVWILHKWYFINNEFISASYYFIFNFICYTSVFKRKWNIIHHF